MTREQLEAAIDEEWAYILREVGQGTSRSYFWEGYHAHHARLATLYRRLSQCTDVPRWLTSVLFDAQAHRTDLAYDAATNGDLREHIVTRP